MLVNSYSRQCSSLPAHHYLRRTEYTSALENRFKKIDKKLIQLSENAVDFDQANFYSLFLFPFANTSLKKFACGTTARVIVHNNLFNQSRYQKIDSIKKLFRVLKDNEEGTFFLSICGSNFINQKNETEVFQGHAFTLVKVIEEGNTGYLLAQSYVEEYSLKDFIFHEDRYFYDYSTLKEKILRPYLSILY